MNEFGTAREALLVEALGDFGQVIDRIDALQSALVASTQALDEAERRLADRLSRFEREVDTLTGQAKVLAVKHIIARTDEAARRSIEVQRRALAEAGHAVFKTELAPVLQRLAEPLRGWAEQLDRPWHRWLTHASAALVAATLTATGMAWLWPR